jgi:hypothetical protein
VAGKCPSAQTILIHNDLLTRRRGGQALYPIPYRHMPSPKYLSLFYYKKVRVSPSALAAYADEISTKGRTGICPPSVHQTTAIAAYADE